MFSNQMDVYLPGPECFLQNPILSLILKITGIPLSTNENQLKSFLAQFGTIRRIFNATEVQDPNQTFYIVFEHLRHSQQALCDIISDQNKTKSLTKSVLGTNCTVSFVNSVPDESSDYYYSTFLRFQCSDSSLQNYSIAQLIIMLSAQEIVPLQFIRSDDGFSLLLESLPLTEALLSRGSITLIDSESDPNLSFLFTIQLEEKDVTRGPDDFSELSSDDLSSTDILLAEIINGNTTKNTQMLLTSLGIPIKSESTISKAIDTVSDQIVGFARLICEMNKELIKLGSTIGGDASFAGVKNSTQCVTFIKLVSNGESYCNKMIDFEIVISKGFQLGKDKDPFIAAQALEAESYRRLIRRWIIYNNSPKTKNFIKGFVADTDGTGHKTFQILGVQRFDDPNHAKHAFHTLIIQYDDSAGHLGKIEVYLWNKMYQLFGEDSSLDEKTAAWMNEKNIIEETAQLQKNHLDEIKQEAARAYQQISQIDQQISQESSPETISVLQVEKTGIQKNLSNYQSELKKPITFYEGRIDTLQEFLTETTFFLAYCKKGIGTNCIESSNNIKREQSSKRVQFRKTAEMRLASTVIKDDCHSLSILEMRSFSGYSPLPQVCVKRILAYYHKEMAAIEKNKSPEEKGLRNLTRHIHQQSTKAAKIGDTDQYQAGKVEKPTKFNYHKYLGMDLIVLTHISKNDEKALNDFFVPYKIRAISAVKINEMAKVYQAIVKVEIQDISKCLILQNGMMKVLFPDPDQLNPNSRKSFVEPPTDNVINLNAFPEAEGKTLLDDTKAKASKKLKSHPLREQVKENVQKNEAKINDTSQKIPIDSIAAIIPYEKIQIPDHTPEMDVFLLRYLSTHPKCYSSLLSLTDYTKFSMANHWSAPKLKKLEHILLKQPGTEELLAQFRNENNELRKSKASEISTVLQEAKSYEEIITFESLAPIGIHNSGNNCFLISIILLLSNIPIFFNTIISHFSSPHNTPLVQLQRILVQLEQRNRNLILDPLLRILFGTTSIPQEDVGEYFLSFLSLIDPKCQNIQKLLTFQDTSRIQGNNSPFRISEIRTERSISIPISETLEEGIRTYFCPFEIDYNSQSIELGIIKSTVQKSITFPTILSITRLIFEFDEFREKTCKNCQPCQIPSSFTLTNGLNGPEQKTQSYTFSAAFIHHGSSPNFGHYSVLINDIHFNYQGASYLHFNNEIVTAMNESEAITMLSTSNDTNSVPYILFYSKTDKLNDTIFVPKIQLLPPLTQNLDPSAELLPDHNPIINFDILTPNMITDNIINGLMGLTCFEGGIHQRIEVNFLDPASELFEKISSGNSLPHQTLVKLLPDTDNFSKNIICDQTVQGTIQSLNLNSFNINRSQTLLYLPNGLDQVSLIQNNIQQRKQILFFLYSYQAQTPNPIELLRISEMIINNQNTWEDFFVSLNIDSSCFYLWYVEIQGSKYKCHIIQPNETIFSKMKNGGILLLQAINQIIPAHLKQFESRDINSEPYKIYEHLVFLPTLDLAIENYINSMKNEQKYEIEVHHGDSCQKLHFYFDSNHSFKQFAEFLFKGLDLWNLLPRNGVQVYLKVAIFSRETGTSQEILIPSLNLIPQTETFLQSQLNIQLRNCGTSSMKVYVVESEDSHITQVQYYVKNQRLNECPLIWEAGTTFNDILSLMKGKLAIEDGSLYTILGHTLSCIPSFSSSISTDTRLLFSDEIDPVFQVISIRIDPRSSHQKVLFSEKIPPFPVTHVPNETFALTKSRIASRKILFSHQTLFWRNIKSPETNNPNDFVRLLDDFILPNPQLNGIFSIYVSDEIINFSEESQKLQSENKRKLEKVQSQQEKTTTLPQEKTTALPQEKTTALPQEKTTALPQEKTTALPQEKTTALPQEKTTALPQEKTTALQQEEASVLHQEQIERLQQQKSKSQKIIRKFQFTPQDLPKLRKIEASKDSEYNLETADPVSSANFSCLDIKKIGLAFQGIDASEHKPLGIDEALNKTGEKAKTVCLREEERKEEEEAYKTNPKPKGKLPKRPDDIEPRETPSIDPKSRDPDLKQEKYKNQKWKGSDPRRKNNVDLLKITDPKSYKKRKQMKKALTLSLQIELSRHRRKFK